LKGKGWMEKTIYTREYRVVLRLLREARQASGLTQVDLAKKLAITQSLLSKMERGDRRIDVVELRALCTAIGLDLVDFVRRLERDLRTRH
jgi:transcriptional regulator with XRE-family HTH domain